MRRPTKRKMLAGIVALLLLAGAAVGTWLRLCDAGEPDDADLDPLSARQSTDLEKDRQLMWETENGVSTVAAIRAAYRVIYTVQLIGLTRREVIAVLGDPHTTGTRQHSSPWYPAGWRDLVYRFDNGMYGVQFNIKFDWKGKVRRVQCLGIE